MTIKIGTTTLNVTECYAYRYQNGKLVLKITLPKTEIGHDDLYDLVKNNTGDVLLTNDDQSTETFSGYSYTLTILTNDTEYQVEVECISETERKVGNLQTDLNTAEGTIISLQTLIAQQTAIVEAQAELLAAQSREIDDNLITLLDMIAMLGI